MARSSKPSIKERDIASSAKGCVANSPETAEERALPIPVNQDSTAVIAKRIAYDLITAGLTTASSAALAHRIRQTLQGRI